MQTEPGNPFVFFSAGEDGTIRQFDIRQPHTCQPRQDCKNAIVSLKNGRDLIDIYSISLNQMNPNYFVIGGGDPVARVYDRRLLM
jgi:hypothetical protein